MRASRLLLSAFAILGMAQAQTTQAPCIAPGLLNCVNAPLSTTCLNLPCGCSQIQYQAHCYTSLCPGSTVPDYMQTALSNLCGATAVPTGAGGVASATLTGGAGATATSKAGAEGARVAGVGGVVGAALGVLVLL